MNRRTIREKEEDHKSGPIEEDESRLMISQMRMVDIDYSE
jgi:hypothetical protein